MSGGAKLCMCCMTAVPSNATRCPNCGYNGKQQNEQGSLPIGYRLGGRYIVGMRRAEDGDSVSYIGYDCTLNRTVHIQEFFLHNACERDPETFELMPQSGTELHYKTALMDFSDLYKNLRKIEGEAGIIRTADFFEMNNTAYAIIDTFNGITLREFLSMAGGSITTEQAVKLLKPVFSAVEAIHAVNLIHRGISPETIFVNRNGDVKLGGFATSQVRTRGTEVAGKLYSGYAAPEQYAGNMWQGTATDVYALAAVFYRCVTGMTPQDADQRRSFDTLEPLNSIKPSERPATARAIAKALLINSKERVQSAEELLLIIENSLQEAPQTLEPVRAAEPASRARDTESEPAGKKEAVPEDVDEEERQGKNKVFVYLGITAAIIVLAVGLFFAGRALLDINRPQDEDPPPAADARVEVNNYIGKRQSEVVTDRENFEYKFVNVYESETDTDVVLRQEPQPGTMVMPGSTVTLYVNKGLRIDMPNVVGMSREDAESKLRNSGIEYEWVEEVSTTKTAGTIIRQSIAEGERINPATQKVLITIAIAPSPDPTPTPDPEGEPIP